MGRKSPLLGLAVLFLLSIQMQYSEAVTQRAIQARSYVASLAKQPQSQFRITKEGRYWLKYSRRSLYEVKVYNIVKKSTSTVTFDERGRIVNRNTLLSAEIRAKRATLGSLSAGLSSRLKTASASERIPVVIYVKDDGSNPMPRFTEQEVDTIGIDEIKRRQDLWYQKRQALWAKTSLRLNSRFSRQGIQVNLSSQYRSLKSNLSKLELNRLKTQSDIIISEDEEQQPFLRYAIQSVMADQHPNGPLTPWQWGYTGRGALYGTPAKVGVVDHNPVYFNLYRGTPARIRGIARINNDPSCRGQIINNPVNKSYYHGTGVASAAVMLTRDGLHRGIAYNGEIVSGHPCANDSNGELNYAQAWNWVKDRGATVVTYSLGTIRNGERTVLASAADDFVRNRATQLIIAAGNLPSLQRPWVASPALAYNVVAVGAYNDGDTRTWRDDRMATFSSWKNPPSAHSDFEKPDIAAPGSGILIADGKGGLLESGGTSYAAPIVASAVTIIQEANLAYAWWPEQVKAILAATAWNNVDGPIGFSGNIDLKDGAGGMVMSKMWQTALDYRLRRYGKISKNTKPTNKFKDVYVQAGQRLRAALAFSGGYSGYSLYDTQPASDFDLVVEYNGTTIADSSGFDRTLEFLEIPVFRTGWYRLRVVVNRAEVDTFYAVAASVANAAELAN